MMLVNDAIAIADRNADLSNLAGTDWDVAVVGGGVAGGVAAAMLAGRGQRVVLIEKSKWPRDKVCGGCLSRVAVRALERAGLGSAISGAEPIDRAVWHIGRKSISLATPGGFAISRADLDSAIVSAAIKRGCRFVPATAARLLAGGGDESDRAIELKNSNQTQTIRARVVLACDGISGTSVDAEPWAAWKIARSSLMGISITLDPNGVSDSLMAPRGEIHMHLSRGGYVGAVRLPLGHVHFAAAIDPACCRAAGGPSEVIGEILRSCGKSEIPDLRVLRLRGAGSLTRRRSQLGGHRVIAVGDACGYIEPFTGEGMAWAIQSAVALAEFLPEGVGWPTDLPMAWGEIHRKSVQRKQRWCAALRPLVHRPALAGLAMTAGRAVPALANFLSRRISQPQASQFNFRTPVGDVA